MAKNEIKSYKLLPNVGTHYEPNLDFDKDVPEGEDNLREIEYRPGDIVKSPVDLVKKFSGKFEYVHAEEKKEEEKQDVTPDFASAREGGLQVFKSGGKFFVHEEGKDAPMEGSEDGLSRKAAEKFIKEQVKTEE